MRLSGLCFAAIFALLLAVLPAHAATDQPGTTPTASTSPQNYAARDDGIRRELNRDQKLEAGQGGSLEKFVSNVMVDSHGECRWLDNNNTELDYFVPTGTPTDWASFYTNAPSYIRVDRCCPEVTATLTASDGVTTYNETVPVGRDGSTGPMGRHTVSHVFNMTDGSASWTETVSEEYRCEGGVWSGQGQVISGGSGTWDVGAWSACDAACDGTQTRTVVCKDSGGAVVADAMCGGSKPVVAQTCGGACPGAGSCKTYVISATGTHCTPEVVDKRRGKSCDPATYPDTQDFAMCTIEMGCACETPIVAGCFVDTFNWDVFHEEVCSGMGGTYGDIDGNRSATFSVGDTPTPGLGGRPPENYHFAEPERYTVNWTGDCVGSYSMCGGVASGSFGHRTLTTTVTVYDKYLDKTYTFGPITAQVNTIVCGYYGYPACPTAAKWEE